MVYQAMLRVAYAKLIDSTKKPSFGFRLLRSDSATTP